MAYNIAKEYRKLEEANPSFKLLNYVRPNLAGLISERISDSQLWYFERNRNIWLLNDRYDADLNGSLDTHVFGLWLGVGEVPNDESWKPPVRFLYMAGNYNLDLQPSKEGRCPVSGASCPMANMGCPEGYAVAYSAFQPAEVTNSKSVVVSLAKKAGRTLTYMQKLGILKTNLQIARWLPEELGGEFRSRDFYIKHLDVQIKREKARLN